MIPYDDLVAALAAWRTRQGLPVEQLPGGSASVPVAAAEAPPGARSAARPAVAPPGARAPAAVVEDALDVDASALLEESSYESDFALAFGNPGESTSVGVPPPPRSTDAADEAPSPPPPPRRGGAGDW